MTVRKKERGRPKHEITDQNRHLVRFAKIAGVTDAQICELLEISSVNTLKKYYGEELSNGVASLNVQIAGKLFEKAMSGDTGSLIFWAKSRMGWSDKGAQPTDNEIIVTVKNPKHKNHDPNAIERALNES